jgi:hypothetical protein
VYKDAGGIKVMSIIFQNIQLSVLRGPTSSK